MAADVAEVVGYAEDSASPCTVLKPASFAASQMLLFVLGQDASGQLASLTTPPGWTDAGNPINAAGVQARAWYHVFNSGDPSTWDFGYASGSDVAGLLFRITGADVASPTVTVASATTGSNSGSLTGPSVALAGSDDLAIGVICIFGANNAFTETDPAGWTDQGQAQLLTFQAIAGVSKQMTAPGSTGTLAWTGITPANGGGGSMTIAIKSASGGGGAAEMSAPPQRLPAPLLLELAARRARDYSADSQTTQTAAEGGSTTIALGGIAAARKTASVAGRATVVLAGTAAARKTGTAAGAAAVALQGTGAARKTASAAGAALIVLTGSATESTSTSRAQGGTALLALTGTASARRTALPAGRAVVALQGTAGALHRAVAAGTAVVALSGTSTARKLASVAGRAVIVLTGSATETTGTARAQGGVAVLALTGTASARRRALPAGAAEVLIGGTAAARKTGVGAGRATVILAGTGTALHRASAAGRAGVLLLAYQVVPLPVNPGGAAFSTGDRPSASMLGADRSAGWSTGSTGAGWSSSSRSGGPGQSGDRPA